MHPRIDLLCDARPYGYQLAVKGWLFRFFFILVTNRAPERATSAAREKSWRR